MVVLWRKKVLFILMKIYNYRDKLNSVKWSAE